VRHILRDVTLLNGQLLPRPMCGVSTLSIGAVILSTSNTSAPQPPYINGGESQVIGDTFVTSPLETDCSMCSSTWYDRRRQELHMEQAMQMHQPTLPP